MLKPEALDQRIKATIGEGVYEIVWASVYTFQQRLAPQFQKGRVFLTGDAAHLMSPFGARGMNCGIQDVNNLAWKLWLVMAGLAPENLLASYESERKAAAREHLNITDRSMAFITPQTNLQEFVRNFILRRSARF